MMPSGERFLPKLKIVEAIVGVGPGADGIGGDLVAVVAGGRVAAVEDELAAQRVGMAVVAAVLDDQERVVFGLADVLQSRGRRAGVRLARVDAAGVSRGGVVRRRRVAARGRAVDRRVEPAVGVEQQVVGVADAGGVNRQRRVRRRRGRTCPPSSVFASSGVLVARPWRHPAAAIAALSSRSGRQPQRVIRRAHRGVARLAEVQRAVRAEDRLVVQVVACTPRGRLTTTSRYSGTPRR